MKAYDQWWRQVQGYPPKTTLFHYTNYQGLEGILKSKEIWLTDVRYLNDTTELEYGLEFVSETLQEYMRKYNSMTNFVLPTLSNLKNLSRKKANLTAYAACFCESNRVLSQWIRYADEGHGYAMGFDAEKLPVGKNLNLFKVFYDPAEQREIIWTYLDREVRKPLEKDEMSHEMAHAYLGNLIACLTCFKHSVFEEEREWRLVFTHDISSFFRKLQFRQYDRFIIPYFALDLVGSSGELPIVKVSQGHQFDKPLGEEALGLFLEKQGVRVEIDTFDVPLAI